MEKVLDASGHVASGFVWGNNYWLGSKKACEFINKHAPVVLSYELHKNHFENLTSIESPFPVEYKLVWAKHQSNWQIDISTFEKVIQIHMWLENLMNLTKYHLFLDHVACRHLLTTIVFQRRCQSTR